MIKIAIVEDNEAAASAIIELAKKYGDNKEIEIEFKTFDNAVVFLTSYNAEYDAVFLDIEMPNLNGMDAAGKLREIDKCVPIVFITNMQQYAIKGYAVDAIDFILKPVNYPAFSSMMDKVLKILGARTDEYVYIKTVGNIHKIFLSRIKYFEVRRHRMTYHTEDGDFDSWGKITDMETKYKSAHFSRCNSGYLVNLRHVKAIIGDEVLVGDDRLIISRPRRKEFLADLAKCFGRGSNV